MQCQPQYNYNYQIKVLCVTYTHIHTFWNFTEQQFLQLHVVFIYALVLVLAVGMCGVRFYGSRIKSCTHKK